MIRMLRLLFILTLLNSCTSVNQLNDEREVISTEYVTVYEGESNTLNNQESNADTVVLEELESETITVNEEPIAQIVEEKIVDGALVEAEKEIIEKYEKEELLKEDPVNSEAGEAEFNISYKKQHYDFWMKYFTTKNEDRFLRHSKNGTKYKELIESIFEEEGLPKDLFFVGLIESGYNTHIASRAQAVGPWQFIKGTATRYGLRVDSRVDERSNIFKSTRAAAHYFKDLYNIFGSWELALCAYNAGEYRIINAIRRGNTRDYKSLVAKKLLPKETIFYIPKVAAARELWSKNKVSKHRDHEIYNDASEVKLYKSFSAKKLRKVLGLNRSLFKKLNPDMKKDWISKRRIGHRIYVPTSLKAEAVEKLASLKAAKRPSRKLSSSKKRSIKRITKIHKVRRGESLYKIARKYGTTIKKLKSRNSLRRNRIFVGQKLKISKKTLVKKTSVKKKLYIVKKGDNLYKIARRFGTTVNRIVSVNDLSRKTIYPRQRIYLPRLL